MSETKTETPEDLKELTERVWYVTRDLLSDLSVCGDYPAFEITRIATTERTQGGTNVHADVAVDFSGSSLCLTEGVFGRRRDGTGLRLWWVTLTGKATEFEFKGEPVGETFFLFLAIRFRRVVD